MSKYIKELQMKSMETQFGGVTELVIADVVGLDSKASYDLRVELRKRNINLQVVPNNLARKVFERMGLPKMDDLLTGSSAVIWGGEGIIELAREITEFAKKIEKLQLKGLAMAGQAMVDKVPHFSPAMIVGLGFSTLVGLPASRLAITRAAATGSIASTAVGSGADRW